MYARYAKTVKITDVNYSLISSKPNSYSHLDILCFCALNNGQVLQYSFGNAYRKNKVFQLT